MLRLLRIACCAAAAGIVTAPALAQEPFEGLWATDKNYCENEDDDGTDLVPTKIQGGTLSTFYHVCDLASVAPIGDQNAAWNVSLACRGGGQSWEYDAIFAVNRIRPESAPDAFVEINLDDGAATVYYHCNPIPGH